MRTAVHRSLGSKPFTAEPAVRTNLLSLMRVRLRQAHFVIEGSIDIDPGKKEGGSRSPRPS